MALFGTCSTVRDQLAQPAHFAAAFAYVEACLRPDRPEAAALAALASQETRRVELAGGAFALLQAYPTKPRSEGRWETHRAFIDVQAVVAGEELMEVAARGRLALDEDLTPAKDVIFYRPFGAGSTIRLGAGDVAVYFPSDGHCGGLMLDGPQTVRKVVVKVPVAGFAT